MGEALKYSNMQCIAFADLMVCMIPSGGAEANACHVCWIRFGGHPLKLEQYKEY